MATSGGLEPGAATSSPRGPLTCVCLSLSDQIAAFSILGMMRWDAKKLKLPVTTAGFSPGLPVR